MVGQVDSRTAILLDELARVDGATPASAVKHRRMAERPFLFFRGSASLYYRDIAADHPLISSSLLALPLTGVMGDCHVSNFGFLTEAGSFGDRVIFSPNDFDDACVGHAVWDLLRFCISVVLTGEECRALADESHGDSLLSSVTIEDDCAAMRVFLSAYTDQCRAVIDDQDVQDSALESFPESHMLYKPWRKAKRRAYGGKHFDSKSALAKAVDLQAFPLQFRPRESRFRRLCADRVGQLETAFAPYLDDRIVDVVERLNAGTGSINMSRFYFLVGPNARPSADSLGWFHIVEVKQQRQAAPLAFFSDLSPNNRLNPAHLTAVCQRRMQRRPDLVLDEAEWEGAHWLIRSRHHARVSLDPEDIGLHEEDAAKAFRDYASACGAALALAHSRGDRRSVAFEQGVVDCLPDQFDAIIASAKHYARVVAEDCERLRASLPS